MTRPNPSFLRRIALAFGSFFAIIGNAELAGQVLRLRKREDLPAPESGDPAPAAPTAVAPPALRENPPDAALQLLGLLQRDARFVDFLQEDMSIHADSDIGAAARIVHEGCRKVLREHFTLEPVRSESEGSRITLQEGFDASAIRLTGNVVGEPPFTGSISHRGWRVVEARLPKLTDSHDPAIVAQAEVEL